MVKQKNTLTLKKRLEKKIHIRHLILYYLNYITLFTLKKSLEKNNIKETLNEKIFKLEQHPIKNMEENQKKRNEKFKKLLLNLTR